MLLLGALPVSAWAQANILDQGDPGQIERRIEPRKAPRPTEAPAIELPAPPAPRPATEAESFVLTAVVVEGATAFGPEALGPLYQDQLAQRITLAEVEAIVARITKLYQDAGFLLSRAVAPPQDLAGGVLQVRVIEGYVDKVTLEGEPPLRRYVPYGDRIKDERPLSRATLERNVLLLNDLPGVMASPGIRPLDENAGRYELVLAIERDAVDGTVYLDNRGTPAVGRLQSWASLAGNDLLGLGERLQLGHFSVPNQPSELQYAELAYDQPLGTQGTRFASTLSVTFVDAGDDLDALDVESRSNGVSLSLHHPVIRRRDQSLWLSGIFDVSNTQQDQLGVKVMEDRLRVLRGRSLYSIADDLEGNNFLQLEVSQGLDALGASSAGSPELSRADGHSRFTKVGVTVTRQQAIGESFALQVTGTGQWSSEPLLSSEEFALGGSQFGRAFDFAEITGEHGVAGSAELIYGLNFDGSWVPGIQLYGFYDAGVVWNEVNDGVSGEALSSFGGGLRLRLGDWGLASVEVAKPIDREVQSTGSDGPRVFFSLSASF
ncbi:MAG: ShlB/FhaC/HecB family hemolysin secretion/activation protein [Kiloniellales bacterium]